MKNGLVIWNVLLTLLGGYLLFAQFNKKGPKDSGTKKVISSTDGSSNSPSTRAATIAYFDMDSVQAHFEMVKDVQSEIQNKEKKYTNDLAGLDATYRKKIQGYQEKGNSMTQDEYQRAQEDLKQTEAYLKGQKQQMDEVFQDFVTRQQLGLKKKIEEYIAEYNKDSRYSFIIVYEPGLFYYKDTSYNITSEVIKGLNEKYIAEKKK